MHNNSDSVVNKINMSSTTGYKDDDNSPMIANEVHDSAKVDYDNSASKSGLNPHVSYKQTWVRWPVLCFACCFLIGSYFCYDNPGPIEKTMEADLNIPQTQWNLLYSVYSYPNIVLPIFGGIFLDMIGLR